MVKAFGRSSARLLVNDDALPCAGYCLLAGLSETTRNVEKLTGKGKEESMPNELERLNGSDEVSFLELAEGLWKYRVLILSTALLITGLAMAYAFLTTPIYQARVLVQPPTQDDISQLNYGRGGDSGFEKLTSKKIFATYVRNLQSESLRRDFFEEVYLPSLAENKRRGMKGELFERFNHTLTIVSVKETPDQIYVQVSLADPEQAAHWVELYTQQAGERAKRELIKDVRADAKVKAKNLEQQIRQARESTRKHREDQIIQLTEAIRIANSIGLEKPPIIDSALASEVSAGMGGVLTYMRGSKALMAEVENLRNRPSDDPFIENLRKQQESLNFYRSLEVDPASIEVYRQDGAVQLPDEPVKPQKAIIIGVGALAGLTLGVLLALMRNFVVRREAELGMS
ncbi:Wzz/FepE/Etk N-terminal domain-containing protein [Pseudomonas sp. GD03860]|uniref:LPS O-antigen chain length determinant protein WzzB n=2 Tax=Pseudomonas TaxID=286 RepID=UPI00244750B1|nr:Wzz/FepE/Etk N-terminal domain-containing protein [Pseudomonas sp. GD03860]MDH0640570.1 Wzz/FepE/Etk N-terminal domain-containing protein [Pseudomonas sp. GD03860]